jgi:hypothetical protein
MVADAERARTRHAPTSSTFADLRAEGLQGQVTSFKFQGSGIPASFAAKIPRLIFVCWLISLRSVRKPTFPAGRASDPAP